MDDNNNNTTDLEKTTNLQIQDQEQQRAAATTEEADQHHQEQDEEALSLSGLILNSDEVEFQERSRSSSADITDIFEFFSDRKSSEMSHAEDIIFCGKLIPYKEQNRSQLLHDHHHHDHPPPQRHHFLNRNEKQQKFHRLRSESLNDLRTSRPSNSQLMRNSRSLDYQKLYGNISSSRWPEKLEMERSTSTKSTTTTIGGGRFDPKEKIPRPRWYMMFGLVKFPPEMDFQDMKSRQVRRNPGTLFASTDGAEGKALVNRVDQRRCSSSWDLLRVLSCKDHASVSVTTPFGCLQEI